MNDDGEYFMLWNPTMMRALGELEITYVVCMMKVDALCFDAFGLDTLGFDALCLDVLGFSARAPRRAPLRIVCFSNSLPYRTKY